MNPKLLLAQLLRLAKKRQSGSAQSESDNVALLKMVMSQYGVSSNANTFDGAIADFKRQATEKGLGDKVELMESLIPKFRDRKINGPADLVAVMSDMTAAMGADTGDMSDMLADLEIYSAAAGL